MRMLTDCRYPRKVHLIWIGACFVLPLLVWILSFKFSHRHDILHDDAEITIQSDKGLFVSADKNKNNMAIADRMAAASWESYQLQSAGPGVFRIRTMESDFLGVDSNLCVIKRGFGRDDSGTLFHLDQGQNGLYKISDSSNCHFYLTSENSISCHYTGSPEAAFIIRAIPRENFDKYQMISICIALFVLLNSLIQYHLFSNKKLALIFLLLGGFILRLTVAALDLHFNVWDEQFHALVAKNMIHDPFQPMLFRTPVLPFDENNWVTGHVWLHKQPLFLWQIALSLKIFGITTLAVRIPSIIMSTVAIWLIYRIGRLTVNNYAGYVSALFFSVSHYSLELAAGAFHTDHNDVAFFFYVTSSIWAWVEFENSTGKRKWLFLLLVGVAAGCAILVKWVTGLLIYSGWIFSILAVRERRKSRLHYVHVAASFLLTLLIALPWQLYILIKFPALSRYEYELSSRHFFEVIEGHAGEFFMHVKKMSDLYGFNPIVIGLAVICLVTLLKNRVYKLSLVFCFLFTYLFYEIAATKMGSFTYCIVSIGFLSLGALWIYLSSFGSKKLAGHVSVYVQKLSSLVILFLISVFMIDIRALEEQHSMKHKGGDSFFYQRATTTPTIAELSKYEKELEDVVIFNCLHDSNVPVMFFNDVVAAYGHIPTQEDIALVLGKGYKVAVFNDNKLPAYILENNEIRVITLW